MIYESFSLFTTYHSGIPQILHGSFFLDLQSDHSTDQRENVFCLAFVPFLL